MHPENGVVDGGGDAEDPADFVQAPCVDCKVGERGAADLSEQDVVSVEVRRYKRPEQHRNDDGLRIHFFFVSHVQSTSAAITRTTSSHTIQCPMLDGDTLKYRAS